MKPQDQAILQCPRGTDCGNAVGGTQTSAGGQQPPAVRPTSADCQRGRTLLLLAGLLLCSALTGSLLRATGLSRGLLGAGLAHRAAALAPGLPALGALGGAGRFPSAAAAGRLARTRPARPAPGTRAAFGAFHLGAVGRRITRVRFTRTAGQLVVGDVHAAVEIVLHVRLPV